MTDRHVCIGAFIALVLLTGCSAVQEFEPTQGAAIMLANDVKTFQCRDGQRFTIAFTRDKKAAQLLFLDKGVPEQLTQSEIAAGIEYGNGKLCF